MYHRFKADKFKYSPSRFDAPDYLFDSDQGIWVFGYGSLMWRPNFSFDYKVKGRCVGVQRSFCIYSIHHRGSLKQPGLVLGLRGGGLCDGMLYHVPKAHVEETVIKLRKREQVTKAYREMFRSVELGDGSRRRVSALCYVADERHKQYASHISIKRKAEIIKHASGYSGSNMDYLKKTISHLGVLGIADDEVRRIVVLSGRAIHCR